MKINMNEWQQDVINGPVKALPMMSRLGLHLTGQTMMQIIGDGNRQAMCVEAVAMRYPAAAAAVGIMDLSVEAEAFGAELKYAENDVPSVKHHVISDPTRVAALERPRVGAARTRAFIEAAEILARKISDRPVFGMMIGPFSLAADLMGISSFLLAMMKEPKSVHALCDTVTTFLIDYARAFKEAGVNGLIVADMSAGLASPKLSHEFASAYFRKLVEAVQDDRFAIVLHNCGKTTKLVASMVSTGAAGLHFGNAVNMVDVAPPVSSDRLVCGNIDPTGAFLLGTPDGMHGAVERLLGQMRSFPNFVLSSGCDVPADTPIANVDAFFGALATHNGSCLSS